MSILVDLAEIRAALLAPFAAVSADVGVALVTYQATPQGKPWPVAGAVVRAVVGLPSRADIGAQVDRIVRQDGTMTLQWLFPRGVGMTTIINAIEATVAVYHEQTLPGGVILTGDASATRMGTEGDRLRWDVIIPWRTVATESAAGDTSPLRGALPTTSSALATVRNLWLTRIEQAVPADGWAGLQTFYDSEPVWAKPPALPFAGYWLDTTASASREAQSGTEQVLGRALVQIHTDKDLGVAVPLDITSRIVAQHNRTQSGVIFRTVQTLSQSVSPAGTFQTNLRIPFQFERLRLL